ncbi:MAG: anaerobic ribonucleoside-triphosphate reductase activating protein, partial [Chitinivibrionales bacterium]|nr:anaerobic ribonucleoside-triphosphate reductase activating protein [Chitinivibrionales bacterium]MBD3394511.1 anaerobic ribonucleoside-triphosphate reductase activating protein [Chitinivibrionales bacterium]
MRTKLVGLGGWLKNSFIDFPGTVSTVLFFAGCNLRCPYCHNVELVRKTVDQSLRSDEFWDFLDKRKGRIDGVVLSGGEPTLYPYLREVVDEIHERGYRVKLDTNGLLPEVAETFAVDYLALDVKTLPSRYRTLLGAGFDDVEPRLRRSLDRVRAMGDNAEVRITVAPRVVDRDVVRGLCPLLEGVRTVILQPMDQNAELLDLSYNAIAPVEKQEIWKFREMLAG